MKSLSLTQPHAIIMVGIPGSGKTTFAKKFAETFGAPHLHLEKIAEFARDSDAAHTLVEVYLEELVKTKSSLIIDIDSMTRAARTELAKILRKYNYQPLFVWVQTDQAAARYRSQKKHTPDAYDAHLKRFSPPHESEQAVVISGRHTYATQARTVLKRLAGPRVTNLPPVSAPVRPAQQHTQSSINIRQDI